MKPIEINRLSQATPVRPEQADKAGAARAAAGAADAGAAAAAGEPAMVARSAEASAGEAAPADTERVAEIRSAIKEGRYPLIPTQVADAIIAAGYLLTDSRKDA